MNKNAFDEKLQRQLLALGLTEASSHFLTDPPLL